MSLNKMSEEDWTAGEENRSDFVYTLEETEKRKAIKYERVQSLPMSAIRAALGIKTK